MPGRPAARHFPAGIATLVGKSPRDRRGGSDDARWRHIARPHRVTGNVKGSMAARTPNGTLHERFASAVSVRSQPTISRAEREGQPSWRVSSKVYFSGRQLWQRNRGGGQSARRALEDVIVRVGENNPTRPCFHLPPPSPPSARPHIRAAAPSDSANSRFRYFHRTFFISLFARARAGSRADAPRFALMFFTHKTSIMTWVFRSARRRRQSRFVSTPPSARWPKALLVFRRSARHSCSSQPSS